MTGGGAFPARKGKRREREIAHLLGGVRVPLSGSCDGFPGDVLALGLRFECKARRDGFRELYKWLDGADALAVRADRREWLIVLPLARFQGIAGGDRP